MEETFELYYPPGVKEVVGFGSSSFIGFLSNNVALKCPHVKAKSWNVLEDEARIYKVLGTHRGFLDVSDWTSTEVFYWDLRQVGL